MSKRQENEKQYHSYKWFAKKYYRYKKEYFKRVDEMIERGRTPYDATPDTYKHWKTAYIAEYNDRKAEMAEGQRKAIGNINMKLISDGVYKYSEKKAYAIFDYMKTLPEEERKMLNFSYKNINDALAKIREGTFVDEDLGLWDKIRARRAELFAEGKSKHDVRSIVSNEFFYPKEEKK